MDRPDVESIETRLKELIAGPTYVEAQLLIGFIHQLETDIKELMDDYQDLGEDFAKLGDEVDELRAIGEEFIERRDRGEIRSTYTYNKFKEALGK